MKRSLFAALLLTCCTDASLVRTPGPPPRPIDNLMSVSGRFCTEDPLAVEFPVKLLFVVDTSDSMSQTDPPVPADGNFTGRARAVMDVINAYAGVKGLEIALLTFHSSINDLTKGFLPNVTAEEVAALTQAAANLASEDGQTNYEGALDAAFQVVLTDIQNADETTRARSKYAIVFLSDGLPNPIDPPTNTPESITRRVEVLQRLERERRLGELKIHTVYLSGRTPPQFQAQPIALLEQMAEAGHGTFRNVGNGEKINFLAIDFTSFRRMFTLRSFVVTNVNARPLVSISEAVDSDGDGLSDLHELRIGTDPARLDTDGDGFRDFLEDRLRNAGFDPLDPADADCQVSESDDYNRRDDDGDGYLNCEERFVGTNPRLFDSDRDGLGDAIELAGGISPVADDYYADPDRDGVASGFELRDHSNPHLDDRALFPELHYRYDLRRVEVKESRVCYEFDVAGIALTSPRAPEGGERGWNELRIIFGQAPADAPDDFGTFRIACAKARYLAPEDLKLPARGRIELTEANFKRPDGPIGEDRFDAGRDCVAP